MSKGKGIAGIIAFIFFTMMSIGINISMKEVISSEEASMTLFVISLLIWSTGFLIPGIICLLEYEVKRGLIFVYLIIPITLLWFLIYTFIISALAPSTFMSSFQEFLGIGVAASIILGIIATCLSYLQVNQRYPTL